MRPKVIKIEDIVDMFKEQKVMTLDILSKKAKCSGKTILRRLKEHGYHTSYNMNGKYYTLPEIATFDEHGFWKHDNVCFNKFGGLKEIVKRAIESSEMGYTVDELNKRINVNYSSHVLKFVREGVIARRKYGAVYTYFSTDKKKQKIQVERREQHVMTKEIIESEGHTSFQGLINMKMIQTLPAEKLKTLEKRHEIILAHEKFGIKIGDIVDAYGVSVGAYYYWKNKYIEGGFLGLVDKKKGPRVPHNKTPEGFENKMVEIASNNKKLDANDIHNILREQQGFTRTTETVRRILSKHGLNRPKGRRSKKKMEMKKKTTQLIKTKS